MLVFSIARGGRGGGSFGRLVDVLGDTASLDSPEGLALDRAPGAERLLVASFLDSRIVEFDLAPHGRKHLRAQNVRAAAAANATAAEAPRRRARRRRSKRRRRSISNDSRLRSRSEEEDVGLRDARDDDDDDFDDFDPNDPPAPPHTLALGTPVDLEAMV